LKAGAFASLYRGSARPNMAKYVRVGREVRHAMQALTPAGRAAVD
jgi:hypothetical protein